MDFAPVQLHTHLVTHIQVQDDTVGGIVVVLICILSDCTGSNLRGRQTQVLVSKDDGRKHFDVIGSFLE